MREIRRRRKGKLEKRSEEISHPGESLGVGAGRDGREDQGAVAALAKLARAFLKISICFSQPSMAWRFTKYSGSL